MTLSHESVLNKILANCQGETEGHDTRVFILENNRRSFRIKAKVLPFEISLDGPFRVGDSFTGESRTPIEYEILSLERIK